jgi:hypothetical protein
MGEGLEDPTAKFDGRHMCVTGKCGVVVSSRGEGQRVVIDDKTHQLAKMSGCCVLTSSFGTFTKHSSQLITTNTSTPLATLFVVLVRAVRCAIRSEK